MNGDEALGRMEKKVSVAAALMLASGHRLPGVRGWELRRRLGKNYHKIVEALDSRLREVGLRVKVVNDPEREDMDRARFYIVLADPLMLSDLPSLGYSLDELAILSASLAYLYSKDDKATMKEVIEALESKYPRWRIESIIDRLCRRGYLVKTDDGVLLVGWRSRVEVDKKELLKAFTEIVAPSGTGQGASSSQPR